MVRSAYALRLDDGDFIQARALVREVFTDADRAELVETVAGSLLGGVRDPVLSRAFDYWNAIDAGVGSQIEAKVRSGARRQAGRRHGRGLRRLRGAAGRPRLSCLRLSPPAGPAP